jgi:DNA-binding winged helix-turn-helix (wHTH) protein
VSSGGSIFEFGPFQLDPERRRLRKGQEAVSLPDRHLDILAHLVAHAGTVLSKDALIEAAWPDVAVTDNSLEQAISSLRRTLAAHAAEGGPGIETVPRRGYRFTGEVTRTTHRESDEDLESLLAPHRAWLEGQAALELLERESVDAARAAFERALRAAPDYAPPHIGMANALVFRFECTRSDANPDGVALATAVRHAREACRLQPGLAEAWATLGFVLSRAGTDDAIAAARRSVALEPDNWRHQLRLASVGWGEERLRAASRALALLPGLGLAHFLAATVHVARQSLAAARRDLDAGAAAQDEPRVAGRSRFSAVGLHWLRGLVLLADGDEEAARRELECELGFERTGHVYAAECCAQVHYAIGALDWRKGGSRETVLASFDRALALTSGHVMALAARTALTVGPESDRSAAALEARLTLLRSRAPAEAAMAVAVASVMAGDHRHAADLVREALARAGAGGQGWQLTVDPLLAVSTHPDEWAPALALLRSWAA